MDSCASEELLKLGQVKVWNQSGSLGILSLYYLEYEKFLAQ